MDIGENVKQLEPVYTVGNVNIAAAIENNMEVPEEHTKTKTKRTTI